MDIVTAPVLASTLRWEHRVSNLGATIDIDLPDGRHLSSSESIAVLNRLSFVHTGRLDAVGGLDRDYAVQEMQALFLSWLHALPGPVVNRPTPQGLGGRWRHSSAWAVLAAQVGLAFAPHRQSTRDEPSGGGGGRAPSSIITAFVVGERVVAPTGVPAEVRDACVRLATVANETLLGVDLVVRANDRWEAVFASPIPDLARGGAALIDALAEVLAS